MRNLCFICPGLILACSLLCGSVAATAQTKLPASVNIGTLSNTSIFAVGQGVLLSSTISASSGTVTPTGTVQFYANDQPLGSPVTITNTPYSASQNVGDAVATVPIQTPGNYTLTASYSGDANFAASSSTYSRPIQVAVNPPGYTAAASPASLTFKAGATTGNTTLLTLTDVNDCFCFLVVTATIPPIAGTPASAAPPTITQTLSSDTNGNTADSITVSSTAPSTVTAENAKAASPFYKRALFFPAAALLLLSPFFLRRRRLSLLPILALFLLLPCVSGCGSSARPLTTTTIPGSAGEYTITVFGTSEDVNTGYTGYFTAQIPVTIG